jgi:carboxypeptidase PM20D1
MKRAALLVAVGIAALLAVVIVRTVRFTPRSVSVSPAERMQPLPGAVERLAAAIRIPTISHGDSLRRDTAAFRTFRDALAASFPRTHAQLPREIIGNDALLFTWAGTDPSLPPVLLMGHMDVVPVEPGTESRWTHAPFSGAIDSGFVWGRGTLDDKSTVLGILEACEALITEGFQPRRTILLAFGADEEEGGTRGAAVTAKLLQARGVKPYFVLDEGGMVVKDVFPGIESPIAVIGIAEKGYVTLELTARGEGGHSSIPPATTAAGILAKAITRLEANPFRGEIRGATANLFDALGREMPFPMRAMFANRWLFDPLLEWRLSSMPRTNATIRTTTAVTMLEGSPKDNVLPSRARAAVNFRILPGDSVAGVIAHVKRTIDDDRVDVRPKGIEVEASPVSPVDGPAWAIVERSIRQIYTDAIIAPYLVIAATDSRYYRDLTPNVYRFAALRAHASDAGRAHGTNERVSVQAYLEGIHFIAQLLRNSSQ